MKMDPTAWPAITSETRPWARWWWPGAAVDEATITRLLETYHAAGIGGVEITSIYGVKGEEHRNIDYLSPAWLDMVRHTVAEAKRLDMQVDLPPGCGWRVGGDFITDDIAAAELVIEKQGDGSYVARCEPIEELVKRAGPGGKGPTFNPFDRKATDVVADHFRGPLADLGIRAQFHDSWEYDTNATAGMFNFFVKRRGYDFRDHLAALAGDGDADEQARVKYDVQRTLAEMGMENFIIPWVDFCHSLGQLARNQAHGSPGNLVDFYAAVDIPETEVFRDITEDTPLLSKFASSGAHVAGRRLTASETGTWMNEHFHGSLGEAKRLVDSLFLSGINHHVYHGTCYSPADAPWPGWLFYASTHFNPQNTLWHDFDALNGYVARCQSILQAGEHDNDLLVYFPAHDVHHNPSHRFGVRFVIDGQWFKPLIARPTLLNLWARGYQFDFISDAWLAKLNANETRYRAIVVPPCAFLPVETLAVLLRLREQGMTVIFADPELCDVPGWADLEARRARFAELIAGEKPCADLDGALAAAGVVREPMADLPDVSLIRRTHEGCTHYFVANRGGDAIDAWVELGSAFGSVICMDPMTGATGLAAVRDGRVRLQLQPGASCVLRTFAEAVNAANWPYLQPTNAAHELTGTWSVTFVDGGPALPDAYETQALGSWTDRGGVAEAFAGTAVYRITFDAPGEGGRWLLDLGDVRASARVRLNGQDVATLIGPAFTVALEGVKRTGNVLEVEVTSLAVNRIRDLDRRGVVWRKFEDINFISRNVGDFDASDWPIAASGLLGPVTVQAMA